MYFTTLDLFQHCARRLYPCSGVAQNCLHILLCAAWSGLMLVLPTGDEWEGHQNALCTSIRFKAEGRAAITEQIELDVAATTQALPALLILSKRAIFTP